MNDYFSSAIACLALVHLMLGDTYLPSVLVAQTVKNLPAMWESWVGSLGQEDPLEKEMATHSSILAWEIPWTEEPSRLQFMGSQSQTLLKCITLHMA